MWVVTFGPHYSTYHANYINCSFLCVGTLLKPSYRMSERYPVFCCYGTTPLAPNANYIPVLCESGNYYLDQVNGCTLCAQGTYSAGGTVSSCLSCPEGKSVATGQGILESDCSWSKFIYLTDILKFGFYSCNKINEPYGFFPLNIGVFAPNINYPSSL